MGAGKVDAESHRGNFLRHLSKLMGKKEGRKRLNLVNRITDKRSPEKCGKRWDRGHREGPVLNREKKRNLCF